MENRLIKTVEQLKKHVGQDLGVGQWLTVTQEMVNRFAEATGDHQFIHVDPQRASKSSFGGTISHGFFTLSMLDGFLDSERQVVEIDLGVMKLNCGLNKVRFLTPVPVGKRIRVCDRLQEVIEVDDRSWVQIVKVQTVELEDSERPAMVAEIILRTYL